MFGYAAKLAGTVYDSQGESLVGALVKVDDGKYAAQDRTAVSALT